MTLNNQRPQLLVFNFPYVHCACFSLLFEFRNNKMNKSKDASACKVVYLNVIQCTKHLLTLLKSLHNCTFISSFPISMFIFSVPFCLLKRLQQGFQRQALQQQEHQEKQYQRSLPLAPVRINKLFILLLVVVLF